MTAQPAKSAGEPILLREVADGVATLTLNRPAARNALSMELMTLLTEELEDIGEDKSIKVVVLAGAGPAFCAGHDLKEIRDTCRALAADRKRGRVADVRPGYLKYPSGAHVIYFRDHGDRLEIVRILHGKQDVQRHLVQ